jgi:hypothetical protein
MFIIIIIISSSSSGGGGGSGSTNDCFTYCPMTRVFFKQVVWNLVVSDKGTYMPNDK